MFLNDLFYMWFKVFNVYLYFTLTNLEKYYFFESNIFKYSFDLSLVGFNVGNPLYRENSTISTRANKISKCVN